LNTFEVAQRAAERAGTGALALVTRERSLMLRFAASRPTQSTGIDDVTVELAVPQRGNVGRASTNAIDDESLADCAARARLAAEAAEATHDGTFPGFDPDYDVEAVESCDPATAELDPASGGAALADAFVEADAHGVEAHGIWTVAEQDQAWATDQGGGEERRTDAFMKVICIAPNGRSGYASQSAVGACARRACCTESGRGR
jgi:predicted Zn-dependent protease